MRIALLGSAAAPWLCRFAKALSTNGDEIYLLSAYDNIEDIGNANLYVYPKNNETPRIYLGRYLEYKRDLIQIKPDIIHTFNAVSYGVIGFLMGLKPVISTVIGSDIYNSQCDNRALLTRNGLANANVITADSNDLDKAVCKLGLKCRVMQFGIDIDHFRPLDVPQDKPIILSIRNIYKQYNQHVIINAFQKVIEKYPEALLVMHDNNPDVNYIEFLKSTIKDYNLADNIVFFPYIPYSEMPIFYNRATAVVSIPSSDSTAISVLESMACGRPTIVADLPSMREWITDGGNGFIATVDIESLSNAIVRAIELSDYERKLLSERARETVILRANANDCLREWKGLYNSVAT